MTIDQYNKHSNGDPFQSGAVATSSSISSFPSTSSSLIGTISQDVNAAALRIKLPSDRWPIQVGAKASGPIAKILHSGVKISSNKETWELVTSGPYMKRLVEMNHYVLVSQKVKKEQNKKGCS